MTKITILGSGMAGLGAANLLRENKMDAVIYEQNPYCGGHTASHCFPEGFTFDEGPHISFTSNERLQKLLEKSVDGEFDTKAAIVNNYWQGHWIRHPAQCNLYGLDADFKVELLKDFISAIHSEKPPVKNYEDWLYASYGKSFAEHFPMRYTRKYHTTDARNLATDWLGPRLYCPNVEELLSGALSPESKNVHYVTEFRYPRKGGFFSYLKLFLEHADVRTSHKVTRIDPGQSSLTFENGDTVPYEHLISSIPLPELIKIVDGVPGDIVQAAGKLACSDLVVVNLGFNKPDIINAHWTYFYDEDIVFSRISTPHLQSQNNVPEGCSSLQVEVYFSDKYKPRDKQPSEYIQPVINDLIKVGLIESENEIIYKGVMHIPYANVIFDLDRQQALKQVHGYLDDIGIAYCGRYGDWAYIWTDQSFLSGERAAKKVLSRMG